MIWRTTALCILLATAGGSALLFVTREVRERERVYSQLQTRISETRETSHVLRAEWAYLNRLDRIREMSVTHLNLVPLTPDRIVRLEDLPARPVPPADPQIADSRVPERVGAQLAARVGSSRSPR